MYFAPKTTSTFREIPGSGSRTSSAPDNVRSTSRPFNVGEQVPGGFDWEDVAPHNEPAAQPLLFWSITESEDTPAPVTE